MKRIPTDFIQWFDLNDFPCQECLNKGTGFSVYRGVLIQWGLEETDAEQAKIITGFLDDLYDAKDRVLIIHLHKQEDNEIVIVLKGVGAIPDKLKPGTKYLGFEIKHHPVDVD